MAVGVDESDVGGKPSLRPSDQCDDGALREGKERIVADPCATARRSAVSSGHVSAPVPRTYVSFDVGSADASRWMSKALTIIYM